MLIRGDNVVDVLKDLAPPFDAETARELIAVAYGSHDAKARTLAQKLVAKHVKGAALIKSTLGAGFHGANPRAACEKLRRLKRPDRGKLAVALRAHGAHVAGVAFEEDADFARDRLYRMVNNKRVLDLHEWHMTPNRVEAIDLTTIPDLVFDELPKLHRKKPFDSVLLWGTNTTLPKRFAEFAPYVKKLRLGFLGLRELPDVVCECTKLEELEVDDYTLQRLNPKIGKLKALKKLRIGRAKQLKELPREVGMLSKLETLELRFLRTKLALPDELAKLTSLRLVEAYSSKLDFERLRTLVPKARIVA